MGAHHIDIPAYASPGFVLQDTESAALLTVDATTKVVNIPTNDKLTINGVIVPKYKTFTFPLAAAAQMISSSLLILPRAVQLVGAQFVAGVVAGQACAVQIEKCTGTTAPGSGTALLTNNTNAGFDATATANTVQTGTLTATTASLQFAAGDRCSMKWGTATSCVGAVITLVFQDI